MFSLLPKPPAPIDMQRTSIHRVPVFVAQTVDNFLSMTSSPKNATLTRRFDPVLMRQFMASAGSGYSDRSFRTRSVPDGPGLGEWLVGLVLRTKEEPLAGRFYR